MSSSKQHPRPFPSRDVPNVTPGQPGSFIGEQGLISHGPSLVLKRLELSGYVEKLFTLDVTLLNSIGLTAPACLTPADFKPFGRVMLPKLCYTASRKHFERYLFAITISGPCN